MLLAFLLLPCFFCGSFGATHEVCYGKTFRFPYDSTPAIFTGKLYFTPSNGEGGRKLVFENGKALDPRFKVTSKSLSLPHVTEKDDGKFSIPLSSWFHEHITLKVLECADEVQKYYHTKFRVDIPSQAETLEFYTASNTYPSILWNRTHTGGPSKGKVKHNSWEISDLTQADGGYYNFRKEDHTLLSRIKLRVTGYNNDYISKEDSHFHMQYPLSFNPWDITFKPSMGDPITVMRSGRLSNLNDYREDSHFEHRLFLEPDRLEINPVKVKDSGIYEFRDNDGFLVFMASVDVEEVETPAYVYVILFVAIVAAVGICCCCIRRCCCKKSASKTSTSQTTQAAAPAPAVYYHGTNQPTGPSYSAAPPPGTYSYQPVNPVVPRQPSPAPASVGPPAYNRVDIHPDPNPTQLEPPVVSTGHGVAPASTQALDPLPSDPDPKFELKGLRFPSVLPLTSDSTFDSVYTSDKLNF
ncbi:uncharacterized protein LOC144058974 [Vanacampus margaritifer]